MVEGTVRLGAREHDRYPDTMGCIILLAREDLMGHNGTNAMSSLVQFLHRINCKYGEGV